MSVVTLEFLRAAALGDINRLRALLAQGVDINSTNRANQTALMLAAAFNRAEIVKFLLTAGANVNSHDDMGLTATDWAQEQTEIIQLINSAERLRTSQITDAARPSALAQTPQKTFREDTSSQGELGSVILRANKRYAQAASPQFTATAAAAATVSPGANDVENDDTVDSSKRSSINLTDDTAATAAPHPASPRALDQNSTGDQPKPGSRVDIPLPQPQLTMSPAIRTLFRVSIVVLFLIAGFVSYHFLTRKAAVVPSEPVPVPVKAAAKPTKSAPIIGGELTGAELFLPDAVYPPDATAESGSVTVAIQVSRKGIVVSAKPLDGDESLRGAAVKAAKSSAFAPDKLRDKQSLSAGTITYNFLKNESSLHGGLITDSAGPTEVVATAGGPLAGAERNLEIPPVPTKTKFAKQAVTVVVRVSRTGRVVSWRPLNVDARLRSWVIRGARASTFDPAKLTGEGDVVGTITYRFQ